MSSLENVRRRILPLAAVCLGLLLILGVVLAPAETRLGNLIKLVYVHGALVWAGLVSFTLAGFLGLVALLVRYAGRSAPGAAPWFRGSRAAGLGALLVWTVYALSSMAVTELTWGQWIAWSEPRVRVTAAILVAAAVLTVVVRLIDHPAFTAAVYLVMGIVPWIVVRRVEAIRHPVNPIGASGSAAIQGFYVLIVATVLSLALILIAWLWISAELEWEQATNPNG